MTVKIFLAHANEDKPQVRELYTALKDKGYEPWLDEVDLDGGTNWREEIPTVIAGCDLFLLCVSHTSTHKIGYGQWEPRLALCALANRPPGARFIIPVKLDDCESLSHISKCDELASVASHSIQGETQCPMKKLP